MKKIIDCGLPLPIQKLYIKRLKYMIWRWEFEKFCGHCPITKNFREHNVAIKKFNICSQWFNRSVCAFCRRNVNATEGCPCYQLKPKTALKRAKDFIERFEAAEDGGEK